MLALLCCNCRWETLPVCIHYIDVAKPKSGVDNTKNILCGCITYRKKLMINNNINFKHEYQ